MLILAIETTGPFASAALTDGRSFKQLINEGDYSHLKETVPMVRALMEHEGAAPEHISAIAVSKGPGSFTGIRIGMATAKGLALIWKKPVICVPTLESFAYPEGGIKPGHLICPMFDARRSQTYAAAYGIAHDGNISAAIPGNAYGTDGFMELLSGFMNEHPEFVTAEFYGDGIKAFSDKLEGLAFPHKIAPESLRFQTADRVARLAVKMYEEGCMTDAYACEPDYMRIPEAERRLREKLAARSGDA